MLPRENQFPARIRRGDSPASEERRVHFRHTGQRQCLHGPSRRKSSSGSHGCGLEDAKGGVRSRLGP